MSENCNCDKCVSDVGELISELKIVVKRNKEGQLFYMLYCRGYGFVRPSVTGITKVTREELFKIEALYQK